MAAPWRKSFLSHVETMESPEFVLGTIHRISAPQQPTTTATATRYSSGGRSTSSLHNIMAEQPLYAPRARTCIFRGLWADMEVNPKNDAPLNPSGVWTSDLLTFTTDCRMDKMEDLFEDVPSASSGREATTTSSGNRPEILRSPTTDKVGEELWEEELRKEKGKPPSATTAVGSGTTRGGGGEKEKSEKLKGCGGGAPVEAVFWAKEPSVQWRFRGRAFVVAPDVETSTEGREVMSLLQNYMRRPEAAEKNQKKEEDNKKEEAKEDKKEDWSFARELTAHFGNLSPAMRGTFRNPPPGRPVHLPVGDGEGLGQKVTDLADPLARANFRVVVIVPTEIDCADLSSGEHPRRWVYTFVGGGGEDGREGKEGVVREGEWERIEVWP